MREKIKLLANLHFNGDIQKTEEYLLEYALKKLGYLQDPVLKTQKNLNLGKIDPYLEDFILEIADKSCHGKYVRAVLQLLEIALKKEHGKAVNPFILRTALISDISPHVLSRKLTRKQGINFVISLNEYDESIVASFYEFCNGTEMRTNKAFSYLIQEVYIIYQGMKNENK